MYCVRYRVGRGILCPHLPAPVGNAGTGAVTRVQVLCSEEILHFN